ncbi:MAG: N-6 DNA methylase [Bacteroidota bacterium]
MTTEAKDRKRLGIYYTPSGAANILCNWAIRSGEDRVLEPSFGACGFLEAAETRLRDVDARVPLDQLYGCDIDEDAFSVYLQEKLGRGAGDGRFLHRDFLSVRPGDFEGGPFDAVVGNPPYVSYHTMDEDQRATAEEAVALSGLGLSPKASLWAYFLVYATVFLKPGGRMAWILPSSFLYAEYAARVREHLADRFDRCLVIQLGQRLFLSEGTEEATIVVLAEGYGENRDGDVRLGFAETLADLDKAVTDWDAGVGDSKPFDGRASTLLLSSAASAAMSVASDAGRIVSLGEVADVRIGIVTGANPFFVIDEPTATRHGLPQDALRPILAKFAMAPGTVLRDADLDTARRDGRKLLLVDTDHPDLERGGSALQRYLGLFPVDKRKANKTFRKRKLWHRPDDGRVPDAFFPYMYQHGPRIILNEAETTSTNTIHRVYFKGAMASGRGSSELPFPLPTSEATVGAETWRRMCAVSILSTFSQLSGELQGRSYGAGVLKHEPSEARRIKLILPEQPVDVDRVFKEADEALREGDLVAARTTADAFALGSLHEEERTTMQQILGVALDAARRRRKPVRPQPVTPRE